MCFLIAGERITRAKNHVNKTMTMEQLLEAEHGAAEWMKKVKKTPQSSIERAGEGRNYRVIWKDRFRRGRPGPATPIVAPLGRDEIRIDTHETIKDSRFRLGSASPRDRRPIAETFHLKRRPGEKIKSRLRPSMSRRRLG
jgi:hypothetical protein